MPDLFPGAVIPEVDAGEVTVEHVRSAVWNHGSLIVRGLVGPERVTQLVDDIDAALEAHESQLEGTASEEAHGGTGPSRKSA